MPLPLHQSRAIVELADLLYPFLPNTAHPYADQRTSFEGVAESAGVSRHWHSGSKRPAIADLLSGTLERSPSLFCGLVIEIVRGGLKYRGSHDPITREEILRLNELVAVLGFKIPELREPTFLRSLPPEEAGTQNDSSKLEKLQELQRRLMALTLLSPVQRGFAFEGFLNDLFAAHSLAPRAAFRLVGEQIDGSFQIGETTYLLEAKWQNALVGQEQLLVLSGKVGGKAEWSRGLLVSVSGFSLEGLDAFRRGKRTNIVCMDGLDLNDALRHALDLRAVIERKARRAAETNDAYVSTRDLFRLGD